MIELDEKKILGRLDTIRFDYHALNNERERIDADQEIQFLERLLRYSNFIPKDSNPKQI